MGQLPKPLSNDELNAIRAKAQAAQNPQAKPATAEDVAYETGIKGLIPVVKRIETLEGQVKELLTRVDKLEAENGLLLAALKPAEVGAVVGTSTGQVVSPVKPQQTT